MLGLLVPDLYLTSIHALDAHALRARGIRALIVDLDNTLVPWSGRETGDDVRAWVHRVRAAGLEPCIVSNNSPRRVAEVAGQLGIPCVPAAAKPRRRAFRRAMERLGAAPQETAVLGDQLFTDILGARRLGLYTILVRPVSERELWWTRQVRRLERWVLARMLRRGLLTGPQDGAGGAR
ncbi:MAG TPA: YqeG family HAD IIIA-type phosphatase [Bacillota bacterium]